MTPGTINYFYLVAAAMVLFYAIKQNNIKQWILMAASIIFLSFFGVASVVVCISLSVLNYYFAKNAQRTQFSFLKLVVINSINIGVLFLLRFIVEIDINPLLFPVKLGITQKSFFALGIGFYSLQNIAFQIDIYKKRYKPDISLLAYTLGNVFFARLASGPIHNINSFQKQLVNLPIKLTEENITVGIQRILLGSIKKFVVAERLAVDVNQYFDHPFDILSSCDVLFACIFYTVELYFDFSGYIDIAVGSAKLFGIQLSENFNMPLRAKSISEWWRRWHITLINWFTQYIYYPIAYRFKSKRNLAIVFSIGGTFLVSAVWHGLGLTYLFWGLIHVFYLIVEAFSKKNLAAIEQKLKPRLYAALFIPITILLVSFSNIFFRASSMTDAFGIIHKLFDWNHFWPPLSFKDWLIHGEGGSLKDLFNFRLAAFVAILYLIYEEKCLKIVNDVKYSIFRIVFMLLILIILGVFDSAGNFIYMEF
jgi:D-alanyl-lipoteichoic acid acyltransferase DltB (MBOAT superfamily)